MAIKACAAGVLWMLAASLPAWASNALEQFELFVQTVPAARGTFTQYTVGPEGQTGRAQSGDFAFARPGQFRWDIQDPYAQQVVSDGKFLYQHDPDLQQLTVRALDQSIGSSPAAILFGQGQLQDAFEVTTLPDQDGMAWLRAVPKQPDAGLNQVDIGLSQGRPARLLLVDGFGQTTQVDLLTLRAQSGFGADEFTIEPPPGTDIVRVQ
jgi:outer membrane lipoprotein carrier protein